MSYLVLNRRSKVSVNRMLPYFTCFYKQVNDEIQPKRLKHECFKNEKNIFVSNEPLSNQMCPLPIHYESSTEDETMYLRKVKNNKEQVHCTMGFQPNVSIWPFICFR